MEGESSSSKGIADTESWEHLGSASRDSSGARLSEIGGEDVKKDLDRLFKKHGSPMPCSDEDDAVDAGVGKEATAEGEDGSTSSDWEKWDD